MRRERTGVDALGRRPWRLGPRARRALDIVLASVLVLGSFTMLQLSPVAMVLSLAQTAPLFARRSHPVLCFALVAAASAAQTLVWDFPLWGQLGFAVALYSVARFGRPAAGWTGLGVGVLGTFVAAVQWTRSTNLDVPQEFRSDLTLTSYLPLLLFVGAIVVTAWALGTQARVREAYEHALLERGERLAAEAEQRALTAAADERARIAREMHDVVAHGLSVIVVQADGARYAAEHRPETAVETLETVSATGREALAEMRRLLGLLRGSADPALTPQPELPDLADLLADHARHGSVHVDLADPLPDVPAGTGLTIYRLVQEALTNVRKHAGADAVATVRLRGHPDAVLVEVVDDGHGAATQAGDGLGLVGMRERVEVHGGTVHAGPEPGGGWAVRARIPR